MPQDMSQDIAAIREWLAKEPYLPQDFEDLMLEKFIHSCYGSLEKTKKCIERFAVTRSTMPEIYTSRDPCSPNLQTAFSITSVTTYDAGENELLMHQLDDPTLENFNFYDLLKSFTVQADYWLKHHKFLPEAHIIVFDMKDIQLRIIPKVNVMYFRDFLLYLLEGMPVRVKQVHVVNTPSFYERLYALVRPVLPNEIKNMIKFHTNGEGLHKYIDKKYLPSDYGGEAESIKDQQKHWVKFIVENRDWFLDETKWNADLKRKPKNSVESTMTMNGSFRTLSID